jgi:hypothetical protein
MYPHLLFCPSAFFTQCARKKYFGTIIKNMKKDSLNIQSSFDETLETSNLKDLAMDYGELSIDSTLPEGLVQEVPIVKTLYSLLKFGANVRDHLFLKKILTFMRGIEGVDPKQRRKMIRHIDGSHKYEIKVGEKLLYIIDSCDDHEVSAQIAKLFRAFLEEEIDYDSFLDASSIIRRITPSDLKWFLGHEGEYTIEESGALLGTGLFNVNIEEISATTQEDDDWKRVAEGGNHLITSVDGGKLWLDLTDVGYCIKQVLSD